MGVCVFLEFHFAHSANYHVRRSSFIFYSNIFMYTSESFFSIHFVHDCVFVFVFEYDVRFIYNLHSVAVDSGWFEIDRTIWCFAFFFGRAQFKTNFNRRENEKKKETKKTQGMLNGACC